jgi:hypothetical protein
MTLDDPVDHILAAYTREIVLRIATDHSDAIPDARTESVAAPIARSAGILTPQRLRTDQAELIRVQRGIRHRRTQPDLTA